MRNLNYYLPGSMLILIAILIVAVPEILVAFAAGSIIMVGIAALYVGHIIRKSEVEFRNVDGWFFDNDFYGRRVVRIPIFRKY